ncbi:conserved membrane hypothetical protein [Mucispirillum schaedleri ASF457]|jgi:lipid A 4'-phosphatase|uniref:Uncharacterized protein n=2 Tax=Mucispirillum TaxID=248038 RepID=V2PYD6_9BACT|nr:phosphatase PAP2 family protein [Mucispirillum schaedleri]USF23349.1 hypothetical protein N508_000407 [Mucispirillum schaedleri ASF457]SIW05172.1 conserved membrane hypothetical protein [Mucispirillum schaedleri ASF457]
MKSSAELNNMVKKILTLLKEYIIEHKVFLALFIVLGILAYKFSYIDILITNLFYNENGFYLADNTFGLIIYEGAYYLTIAVILLLLVMLLLNLFKNIKPFGMPRKAVIFFIVVVIMAPGIVVNSILKENVGRPRPIHITEYGGTAVFQPPFVISNQCENNCSFVSGHAAFAFTFMVIGLLFRNRLRHIICTSGFIFGALVGFVRIFQGKHFFTDVVFAFFFTWLTITLIYKFFYPNDQLPDIIQKN